MSLISYWCDTGGPFTKHSQRSWVAEVALQCRPKANSGTARVCGGNRTSGDGHGFAACDQQQYPSHLHNAEDMGMPGLEMLRVPASSKQRLQSHMHQFLGRNNRHAGHFLELSKIPQTYTDMHAHTYMHACRHMCMFGRQCQWMIAEYVQDLNYMHNQSEW